MIRETAKNYGELSRLCAEEMLSLLEKKPDAVICLATGYSPEGAYREFVKLVRERRADTSRLRVVKLDEWHGVAMDDPSTCETFLRREILEPLGVTADRYIGFDSLAPDIGAECRRVEKEIAAWGGVDWMVLGIGKNGHLGLNEPAEELIVPAHRAELDARTRTHEMLKGARAEVDCGMTLGLGQIFCARRVLLLIAGGDKKRAVEAFDAGGVTTRVPATLLRLHLNCRCILDEQR